MERIQIGKILAHHGVAGWLKVFSYGRPTDSIMQYKQWWIGQQQYTVEEFRRNNKSILAKLKDFNSREQTQFLLMQPIYIERAELGAPPRGQYYWRDLIGMSVVNEQGTHLGQVVSLLETGANDVLQIENKAIDDAEPILIPWGDPYILKVDQANACIHVHWQLEY